MGGAFKAKVPQKMKPARNPKKRYVQHKIFFLSFVSSVVFHSLICVRVHAHTPQHALSRSRELTHIRCYEHTCTLAPSASVTDSVTCSRSLSATVLSRYVNPNAVMARPPRRKGAVGGSVGRPSSLPAARGGGDTSSGIDIMNGGHGERRAHWCVCASVHLVGC